MMSPTYVTTARGGRFLARFGVGLCWLALIGLYSAVFLPFMPNADGLIGEDYSLFLPDLLAGHFWYLRNGVGHIPWFTPAFCGGFPSFADLNAAWFSIPQFLTFLVGPLEAVKLTAIGFAAIGFPGMYLLLRHSYCVSRAAALTTAVLFMFNNFYFTRMLVGHLTFHTFMLAPAVAACVLEGGREGATRRNLIIAACLAGIGFSMMFESGMIHIILPIVLSILVMILLQAMRQRLRIGPFVILAASGLLGLLLSSAKLVAVLSLLQQFPRSLYKLPGLADVWLLLIDVMRGVFFTADSQFNNDLVNSQFLIERHEFEYGITPVALILILGGLIAWLRMPRAVQTAKGWSAQVALAAVIVALLCVPLALNFYAPNWNAMLKSLPLFGNSANLLRWFSVYTLVGCVGVGLGFSQLAKLFGNTSAARNVMSVIAIVVGLGWQICMDHTADRGHLYDTQSIEESWAKSDADTLPEISSSDVYLDANGRLVNPVDRNDMMVDGGSQISCYQPMMGYKLEKFPLKTLSSGPSLANVGGVLNVKNPACYLFPQANRCAPGDHFALNERESAAKFLAYRRYDFAIPTTQLVAIRVSEIAWVAVIVVLAGLGFWRRS